MRVWPTPRAAQTAKPVDCDAHEGSESTAVVPIETAPVQAAQAGCGAHNTAMIVRRRPTYVVFIFCSFKLCLLTLLLHHAGGMPGASRHSVGSAQHPGTEKITLPTAAAENYQAVAGRIVASSRTGATRGNRPRNAHLRPLWSARQAIRVGQNPGVIVLWETSGSVAVAAKDHHAVVYAIVGGNMSIAPGG